MKWAVRTIVFGLLAALVFLVVRLNAYEQHYESQVKMMVSIAANSFFAGCMADQTANRERAAFCKIKTRAFESGLLQAIDEN